MADHVVLMRKGRNSNEHRPRSTKRSATCLLRVSSERHPFGMGRPPCKPRERIDSRKPAVPSMRWGAQCGLPLQFQGRVRATGLSH